MASKHVLLCAALAMISGALQARQAPTPGRLGIVRTASGQLSGEAIAGENVTAFKGVPFAAPPVGDLRWRAPQPVHAWDGVRKADAFSPNCMQNIVDVRKPWTFEFMAHGDISEDCLYLNVWTAAKSPSEKRPVLIFIHGGANTEGSGSVPVYDGEALAGRGLVVVTVNYRLGVLGFFAHPELSKEAPYHASGNYGLLDQIAAVRWVHDNIGGFGGDPSRITVAGQSAGASAVRNLLISPLAKGTFQRAIAESGASIGSGPGGPRTLEEGEQDGVRFAEAKGAHSLPDLRAMSWQQLAAAVPAAGGRGNAAPFRFGPLVDRYALPGPEAEVIASGRFNDVPVLTGSNKDESGASPSPTVTAEAFRKQAQRYGDRVERFLALYPASTDEEAKRAQNDSSRDQARTGTYLWAAQRAKTARTKTFTYFWDHVLPGPDAGQYGAFHTSEVPYVLDTLSKSDRPFTPADRRIADTLAAYWVNFASTGDPNGKGLPHWPSVGESPETTMEVGDRFEPIPLAGTPEKLEFWKAFLTRPRGSTP